MYFMWNILFRSVLNNKNSMLFVWYLLFWSNNELFADSARRMYTSGSSCIYIDPVVISQSVFLLYCLSKVHIEYSGITIVQDVSMFTQCFIIDIRPNETERHLSEWIWVSSLWNSLYSKLSLGSIHFTYNRSLILAWKCYCGNCIISSLGSCCSSRWN